MGRQSVDQAVLQKPLAASNTTCVGRVLNNDFKGAMRMRLTDKILTSRRCVFQAAVSWPPAQRYYSAHVRNAQRATAALHTNCFLGVQHSTQNIYGVIASRSLEVQYLVQYSAVQCSAMRYSTVQFSTVVGQAIFGFRGGVFSHLHERYEGVLLSFAEILLEHHFRHLAAIPTVDKRQEGGRDRPRHQASSVAGNDSEAVGCTGMHHPSSQPSCDSCYGRLWRHKGAD